MTHRATTIRLATVLGLSALACGLIGGRGKWLHVPTPPVPGWSWAVVSDGARLEMLHVDARDPSTPSLGSSRLDLAARKWTAPEPGPKLRFLGRPDPSFHQGGQWLFFVGGEDGYHDAGFPIAALYDLRTGKWKTMSRDGAPGRRTDHVMAFAAGRLVVWGGQRTPFWEQKNDPEVLGNGGIYDPTTDRWATLSSEGAPSARVAQGTAVADQVLIWRGYDGPPGCFRGSSSSCVVKDDGALFDPLKNAWRPLPTEGAPIGGSVVGASGSRAVVFGVTRDKEAAVQGAILDVAKNQWLPLPVLAKPERFRGVHGTIEPIWLGDRLLLVTGCSEGQSRPTTAAILDPHRRAWKELPLAAEACAAERVRGPKTLLLVDRGQLGSVNREHRVWEIDPAAGRVRTAALPPIGPEAPEIAGPDKVLRWHGSLHWTGKALLLLGGIVDEPNPCSGPQPHGSCDPPAPRTRSDGYLIEPELTAVKVP